MRSGGHHLTVGSNARFIIMFYHDFCKVVIDIYTIDPGMSRSVVFRDLWLFLCWFFGRGVLFFNV